MNFLDNYVVDTAKIKFKREYGSAFLMILPIIVMTIISISISISIEIFTHINTTGGLYTVFQFIVSTITMFIVFNFAVMFVSGRQLSLKKAFRPQTKFFHYVVYAVIVFMIHNFLVSRYGDLGFRTLDLLLKPFAVFLFNANSVTGFIVRYVISINIMILVIFEVAILVLHKFTFIPFLIVEDYSITESFRESFNNTTPQTGLVLGTLNRIYLIWVIWFNLFIISMLVVMVNSPYAVGFKNVMEILFMIVMILYLIPLSLTILGELHREIN